ncbi:MAG: hypothetical protein K6D02_01940 [Lachnospiraceae bacterium]|nr:hypothetical protein [Lachnospiraceae bacterium]
MKDYDNKIYIINDCGYMNALIDYMLTYRSKHKENLKISLAKFYEFTSIEAAFERMLKKKEVGKMILTEKTFNKGDYLDYKPECEKVKYIIITDKEEVENNNKGEGKELENVDTEYISIYQSAKETVEYIFDAPKKGYIKAKEEVEKKKKPPKNNVSAHVQENRINVIFSFMLEKDSEEKVKEELNILKENGRLIVFNMDYFFEDEIFINKILKRKHTFLYGEENSELCSDINMSEMIYYIKSRKNDSLNKMINIGKGEKIRREQEQIYVRKALDIRDYYSLTEDDIKYFTCVLKDNMENNYLFILPDYDKIGYYIIKEADKPLLLDEDYSGYSERNNNMIKYVRKERGYI